MASLRVSMSHFAALFISVAILLMGNGLQIALLPVRANLEAFTGIEIGILGSAYFVGFTAGCLAGQMLIARSGHIRAFLALVSVASTVALMHAIFVDPFIWWVLRAIMGFCFAALFVIIESWLNDQSDNTNRGTVFSIYTIINLTVITIGQLMLTLGDPRAFPLFALASILISLSGVPVAISRARSPVPPPVVLPRLLRLYRTAPVGFVGCFVFGATTGAFWAFGPVFAMESGLNTWGIGFFMCATFLGGAAGQWPLGRISDGMDRRIVILVSCAVAMVAGLALSQLYPDTATTLASLGFVYGAFAFPLYALSVAHANDYTDGADFVETSSGLLLAFGMGAVAGPMLATFAIEKGGHSALFLFTAGVHLLTAFFVVWRITRRSPVPEDEKVDFSEALVATQTHAPYELAESSDTMHGESSPKSKEADPPVRLQSRVG
jgi:MFS family permease